MLSSFDWLRRCQTGAELLATLKCVAPGEASPHDEQTLGRPFSAIDGPCQRCWIFAPALDHGGPSRYCGFCRTILREAQALRSAARQAVGIWGFANQLPSLLPRDGDPDGQDSLGVYVHDDSRFLLLLRRHQLESWLRDLVVRHGLGIRGLIQIFPTVGRTGALGMGDVLCRIVHHEANFPMDQLRVRFYSAPYQVLRPHERDRQGVLTFEVAEFLGLLEMARVFRSELKPEVQDVLYELLVSPTPDQEQFQWGRVTGQLSQKARDMLSAWRVRAWPRARVKLLYQLRDYVVWRPSG